MTPAQLERVEEIFYAALDQEPNQVAQFLETACEGDDVLRRKVEALLSSRARAADFMETSAVGLATKIIQTGQADSLVGQTFGHYKISKRIGSGGMGEVYLATDITAGRKAALKLLPVRFTGDAERLKRFQREARAVVGLNHPNILTVYEIGEHHSTHYIASELIEGETLRQRLMRGRIEVGEAVDVAIQVASALAAAHEAGIVHRDIKPENIMLRPDGYVKVLDFGIAKLAESAFAEPPSVAAATFGVPGATGDGTGSMTLAETNLGSILGTVRYMSPEQTCGVQIDKSTDIWSLGVVLYEMVTGHAPFSGDPPSQSYGAAGTPAEVMSAILEKEPPPVTRYVTNAPAELQQIISKTLRKNRAERYHSAYELLEALKDLRHKLEFGAELERATAAPLWLRWTRSPTALVLVLLMSALALALAFYWHRNLPTSLPPEKSIAVLPFENLSRDPDNAYFADGIQEEILTRLASIADLKVISRSSTQQYRSKPRNLREIAKQLGVAHILEGSVQKTADQVRVNVQLVNAQTDSHLWGDTFDRKLTDIFSVESEVARAIADQLRAHITGQEEQEIAAKPTDNIEAYDAYLRGLAYTLKSSTPANTLGAQKYFREAVRLDPKFALSWAMLSLVEARGYLTLSLQPTLALREEARQAAETALTLQPNLGEAVLANGQYHYACLKDYDTAVRYFEQARQLLPNNSRIPQSLAYVTRRQGQWERSESYFNEAERLDPRNVNLLAQHAISYVNLRRFPEALRKLDQVLNITPDDVDTLALKGAIAQAEGDLPRAAALLAPLRPAADLNQALETQVYQAILERRTAPIIPRLKEILAKPDPALGYINGELRFYLGWAQEVAGDRAAARESWRQARQELESFLKEQPENGRLIGHLALTNAGLGDKAAALTLVERAIAANPIKKDALFGPIPLEIHARVAAQIGEPNRAIAALEKLLSIPYTGLRADVPLTRAVLQLDPMFDPLRSDPRFQKLCEDEKSIAVLPFQNLSEEKANAYFAEGIQNEILTKLAAVRDLKVISRTSMAKYQSKPDNLKTVAQELGVSTIVEGAVQRAGDKVRVNVQLIDVRSDTHLWAKSYDRDFKDVLAVESEVAAQIADALKANLSPSESHVLAAARTENTEAYDLFLRGQYEFHQAENSLAADAYDRADAFYRQALARDPNFAEAAAELARNRLSRHWFVSPLAPVELEEVKSLIERALALAPNSPEAHLALGIFFYWGHRQYENALAEFNRTLELQPNNADARAYCAWVYRRRGEWKRSLADSQRAEELDPRDARIPTNIGVTCNALRLWKDAERAGLRALAIDPHNTAAALFLLGTRLNATGDVDSARRPLDGFPEVIKNVPGDAGGRRGATGAGDVRAVIGMPVYLDVIERRFTNAFQAVEKEVVNDDRARVQQLAGRVAVQVLAGEPDAAKSTGEEARLLLEARLRARPDDTSAMAGLSWVYLALGRNTDALRLSRQAADTISIEKDALAGPSFQNGLAQIEARAGAPEEAIKRLRRLLSIPAGGAASIALLKIDPVWDPIRNRPDFQQLASGPEQIGPNK